jgi:hypothetical protein
MGQTDEQPIPVEVEDLVRMARANITKVIGVEPDLTPETLPLVDEYLRQVPTDTADEVLDLAVSAVAAYFGEVVRRRLNGRWTLRSAHPAFWRIELTSCFLYFSPFGMVGEVLNGAESDEYDGAFATLDELRDPLATMLATVPPVTEEEYYSLCGRIDILQLVADWLVGQSLADAQHQRQFTAEDYRAMLDVDR